MSLEAWGTVEELYHSRADEVSEHRPLHTGDVVDDIPIPGVQEAGLGIIVAHPCSMRAGPKLADKVLMASVRPHEPVPSHKWTTGYFDRMPLPELEGPGAPFHAARVGEIGLADTERVLAAQRIACLTVFGVNLLQQRLIFFLTRFDVPTQKLWEAFGHTFEEVDLLEEWTEELHAVEGGAQLCADSFHKWIIEAGRQDQLRDPQKRGPVRIAMRAEIERRLGDSG